MRLAFVSQLIKRLKMGKIVKFCNTCDEGFAEKFGFCPNCGEALQTFEMSPVAPAPAPVNEVVVAPVDGTSTSSLGKEIFSTPEPVEPVAEVVAPDEEVVASPEPIEELIAAPVVAEEVLAESVAAEPEPAENIPESEEVTASSTEEIPVEEPVVEAAKPAAKSVPVIPYVPKKPFTVDPKPRSFAAEHDAFMSEGGFYVTVMEEKNVKQRNALLLGTLGCMLIALMIGVVYSIFAKDLYVGAIGGDDLFLASLVDAPMAIEEQKKKDKDDGGGGGGGGNEEKQEVNRGDLADQSPNPQRPPQALPRFDTTMPLPPASTQGNMKFEKKYDRFGDPNGRFDGFSNGTGSGGGMGSGRGTGQGNGNGTGAGNGNGSGFGNGDGDGNGNGTGSGGGDIPPPPPTGVSKPWRLISKPRPGYTDAARQANIQGTVILKVVFLASGQVGSISAVKGLPNGLTEQAIAAARGIRFEPALVNGIPRAVSKQIEYTFSIY